MAVVYDGPMSKKPAKKPAPKKPLTISIHGDGIDIDASFASGVPDFESMFKSKDGKLFPFSMSVTPANAPTTNAPATFGISDIVGVITQCSPEDLAVITAAITARHTWDAKEAAEAQTPAPDNHQS